jgi:hypothetical protein
MQTDVLSKATLAAIADAPDEDLLAIATHEMERLHTESELVFVRCALVELALRRVGASPATRARFA